MLIRARNPSVKERRSGSELETLQVCITRRNCEVPIGARNPSIKERSSGLELETLQMCIA